MSVVGIDFGSENCAVAVARNCGVDMVMNAESKYETSPVVCFGEKQRFIGTAGAVSAIMNPNNTIWQVKRLIGRRFADLQHERGLSFFPFSVTEGPDGFPFIQVNYLHEQRTFTPTQIFGTVLAYLKQLAEQNLNKTVADCCIGIPVYFTDIQRRAVLDATKIAGLNPLCLIHEMTAVALSYGIYKTDLPENGQMNVAFIDIGHASMQVCITGYRKGEVKVLGHAFDQFLGGRNFDHALYVFFAAKLKQEYNIDVLQNAKACARLMATCQKMKKVLSANPVADLHIECLMDDKDVRATIKREEFEEIIKPILDKVVGPLVEALIAAKLDVKRIDAVEVVGSGSRVPAIISNLKDFFGKEPRRTLNSSECVARGCALQCAILSPTFKVREFQVHESFPFKVALSWKSITLESQNNAKEKQQIIDVFPSGGSFPRTVSLKFPVFLTGNAVSVDVIYKDRDELKMEQEMSTYMLTGPFKPTNGEHVELELEFITNIHGIVSIESATLIEEVEDKQQAVGVANKEMNTTPNESGRRDERLQDTESIPHASDSETKSTAATPNTYGNSETQNSHMETDAKDMEHFPYASASSTITTAPNNGNPVTPNPQLESAVKIAGKNKKMRTILSVRKEGFGDMSLPALQNAVDEEVKMSSQDTLMEKTKGRKNSLEAYVYKMRDKLHGRYNDYATDSEKISLSTALDTVEEWLYDEGEDQELDVYDARLEELIKQGGPIEQRHKEDLERDESVKRLTSCIYFYRDLALSRDVRLDHIDISEKQQIINQCGYTGKWLSDKMQEQYKLPKNVNPVLLVADIIKQTGDLDMFCRSIVTKPNRQAPAPPSRARAGKKPLPPTQQQQPQPQQQVPRPQQQQQPSHLNKQEPPPLRQQQPPPQPHQQMPPQQQQHQPPPQSHQQVPPLPQQESSHQQVPPSPQQQQRPPPQPHQQVPPQQQQTLQSQQVLPPQQQQPPPQPYQQAPPTTTPVEPANVIATAGSTSRTATTTTTTRTTAAGASGH